MQCYTIFFITVNALHVSGGFSVHHQQLKNCTHSIWYKSSLLAATASLTYTRCCGYSFWAPDDGRKTAWNIYSTDSNKEYRITLHLVGYTYKIMKCIQYISWVSKYISLDVSGNIRFLPVHIHSIVMTTADRLNKLQQFNCNASIKFNRTHQHQIS
jgi:hypothetical protein